MGFWQGERVTTSLAEEFETHRTRLFGLAYRLLGSADEAEDAVQDAYLRFTDADRTEIEHPGAWLAKVVTNLCLTRLTSARARRERYVGTWLPEPVLTADGTLGPLESAQQRDEVSLAMLVLLERLTPAERAVYVLREAFGYGHREIAGVLDLSEANCRQLYRRAAGRVAAGEGRFEPAPERREDLVTSFISAAGTGIWPAWRSSSRPTRSGGATAAARSRQPGGRSRGVRRSPGSWPVARGSSRRAWTTRSPRSTARPRCWRGRATRWSAWSASSCGTG